MKRIFFLIFFFTSILQYIDAQEQKITDSKDIELISKEFSEVFSKIESIKCDYIQEKSISLLEENIITKGHIVYVNPQKLYWIANEPVEQSFVMNEDSIKIINSSGTNLMPINQHPVFKEISKLIYISELQNQFVDNANFDIEYFKNDNNLIVRMKPKKSRLKKIIASLNVHFDYNTKLAEKIEITDANNDITTISLSNPIINQGIDYLLFTF